MARGEGVCQQEKEETTQEGADRNKEIPKEKGFYGKDCRTKRAPDRVPEKEASFGKGGSLAERIWRKKSKGKTYVKREARCAKGKVKILGV